MTSDVMNLSDELLCRNEDQVLEQMFHSACLQARKLFSVLCICASL